MKRKHYWIALSLLLVAGAGARADEEAAGPPVAAAEKAADFTPAAFAAVEPASDATLEANRAKAQLQVDRVEINTQNLDGVVTDNVATGNQTGHNTVAEGAFSDSQGFMTTIQNTGNNVLIQNATIINVSVVP